jgi:Helix-turn-helix domain
MPSDAFAFIRALDADERFASLQPTHRGLLMSAAIRHADAEGRFWLKVETWAKEFGKSKSTVERAIKASVVSGLINREPYLRPDGMQGASIYTFDRSLLPPRRPESPANGEGPLASSLTDEAPCTPSDGPTQHVAGDGQPSPVRDAGGTSCTNGDAPELKVEQKKSQQNIPVLEPITRPVGRVIEDGCVFCGKRTKHIDDGDTCVCQECSSRPSATGLNDPFVHLPSNLEMPS